MKALLQRVKCARVDVGEETVGEIGAGLLVLLGIGVKDGGAECDALVKKCAELRIFEDENGKMNRSVCDIGGGVLVVSQFTLFADTHHGRRPSFLEAARPEMAEPLYERFLGGMRGMPGVGAVAHGRFGAEMAVSLVGDGPVTILLDTDEWAALRARKCPGTETPAAPGSRP